MGKLIVLNGQNTVDNPDGVPVEPSDEIKARVAIETAWMVLDLLRAGWPNHPSNSRIALLLPVSNPFDFSFMRFLMALFASTFTVPYEQTIKESPELSIKCTSLFHEFNDFFKSGEFQNEVHK